MIGGRRVYLGSKASRHSSTQHWLMDVREAGGGPDAEDSVKAFGHLFPKHVQCQLWQHLFKQHHWRPQNASTAGAQRRQWPTEMLAQLRVLGATRLTVQRR